MHTFCSLSRATHWQLQCPLSSGGEGIEIYSLNILVNHPLSCIVNIVQPHSRVDNTTNITHITLQTSSPFTGPWRPAGHHQGAGAEDGLAHCHSALSMRSLAGGCWGLSIKLVVGVCAGGGCARTEAAQRLGRDPELRTTTASVYSEEASIHWSCPLQPDGDGDG